MDANNFVDSFGPPSRCRISSNALHLEILQQHVSKFNLRRDGLAALGCAVCEDVQGQAMEPLEGRAGQLSTGVPNFRPGPSTPCN